MSELIRCSGADAQVAFKVGHGEVVLFKRNFLFHVSSPYKVMWLRFENCSLPACFGGGRHGMMKEQNGLL